MIFLGMLAALLPLALGIILAGGNLLWFLEPVSLLAVVLSPLLCVAAGGFWTAFRKGLAAVIGQAPLMEEGDIVEALHVFDLLGKMTLLAGFLTALAGAVMILPHMGIPEKTGQGLAVAVIAPVYGLFLAGFFYLPARKRLEILLGNQNSKGE